MTVTRMLGIYFVLFLLFVAACSGGRSNPTSLDLPNYVPKCLEGTLYGSDGNPLANTEVIVTDLNGNRLGSEMTDVYGHFKFDLDPCGSYKIYARSGSGSGTGWKYVYSDDLSNIKSPGIPQDGGVVSPDGQIRISIPGGELQDLPPADVATVDLGSGAPVSFSIQGTNSIVKIRPSMSIDDLEPYILIEGARGEHEAFQLVPVLNAGVDSRPGQGRGCNNKKQYYGLQGALYPDLRGIGQRRSNRFMARCACPTERSV